MVDSWNKQYPEPLKALDQEDVNEAHDIERGFFCRLGDGDSGSSLCAGQCGRGGHVWHAHDRNRGDGGIPRSNLQDTPIAITAVNAEMLEARGQTNIAQVAAQAPNVSLRPQPQNGGSGLIAFIRGVGQTDFNYALDPGVGVYIDDVYIPTLSSSLLELIDLDRVEILRGPQGTLAGKNSIGGAIKLFSAKPKGDGSGSLRVEYGSYNELNVRGMADFAITDNLAMRVSGMGRGRDGYVAMLDYGQTHPNSNVPQNNTRGNGNSDYATMGGQNVIAGRAALRWTPTTSSKSTFRPTTPARDPKRFRPS